MKLSILLACLVFLKLAFAENKIRPITLKPFTLKTQLNVKDSEPGKHHFMIVKRTKNGRPVGILVKRKPKMKTRHQKEFVQYSDEVQEIIGVRVPDDEDDEIVYRNAEIVNNKLLLSEK